jgi:hypothetical protein
MSVFEFSGKSSSRLPQISRRFQFTIAIASLFTFLLLSAYLLRPSGGYHESRVVQGVMKYKEKASKAWAAVPNVSEDDDITDYSNSKNPVAATRNATLGFGDVLYVSLP